jgi:phosphate transport system substrate-binding protein
MLSLFPRAEPGRYRAGEFTVLRGQVAWLMIGLAALLSAGCARQTVKVDGSSTVLPITEAVGEVFREQRPDIHIIGGRAGTGGGFKKFSNGEIDICNASRPISDVEKEACATNGIEFVSFIVAFDGLSICVNPKNDWCDCISVEQLKAIWQPGSVVTKWSDVDPKWPQQEIKLYGPGLDSGTFDFFTKAIVGQEQKSRSDFVQSEDDNVLVMGVAGDGNALGYFGLAYYENNQSRLKLLAVDPGDGKCLQPSQETVLNGSYKPLSRPLLIYVRKDSLARPDVRAFVEFFLQNVGNEVAKTGYVATSEEVRVKNLALLKETLSTFNPEI